MSRALILGGTGLIGRAAAARLLAAGWRVDVTGRDPDKMPAELAAAGARFVQADRADGGRLRSALGNGADLLVDCLCFTAADARSLLPLAEHATSTVLISSRAVYVDQNGRHVNSDSDPHFDGPVEESQPTMAPAGADVDYRSRSGYGANKVAAERVALDSGLPISVLRPSQVHGVGSTRPREWVFVKRVLDQRPAVLLPRHGTGLVHATAAANLAALIETVAGRPGSRVLNSADPDAPSVLEISRVVAAHLGHDWTEVPVENGTATPWDSTHPMLLDMSTATELGYQPAGSYAETVVAEIDWLVAAARNGDPAGVLPTADDPYFSTFFDYSTEDRLLEERTG